MRHIVQKKLLFEFATLKFKKAWYRIMGFFGVVRPSITSKKKKKNFGWQDGMNGLYHSYPRKQQPFLRWVCWNFRHFKSLQYWMTEILVWTLMIKWSLMENTLPNGNIATCMSMVGNLLNLFNFISFSFVSVFIFIAITIVVLYSLIMRRHYSLVTKLCTVTCFISL